MKKVLLALGIVFSWFWATSSIVYGTDPWSVVSQYIHVNEVKDRVGIHTEFPQTDLHVIWNTMIQWDTAARWKLISDMNDDNADGNFDVWIQGWERWMTGDDRNLALLWYDEDSWDSLRINFNNEYENGTQIDGNLWIGTAATTDTLTVSGSIRATEYCDENGQNCIWTLGWWWNSTCQSTVNVDVVVDTKFERGCNARPTCPTWYVFAWEIYQWSNNGNGCQWRAFIHLCNKYETIAACSE